jgi:NAD-reducing hydrogenase small subunit
MSFLDMDEFLIDLAALIEIVHSPVMDIKEFPENVDLTLVEGAVVNDEHVHLAKKIRANSKLVMAFGDCAVTSNVPAMRNPFGGPDQVLTRAYIDSADVHPQIPRESILPALLDKVYPLHELIHVDIYLPGCPPSAPRIKAALQQLLSAGKVSLSGRDLKFG